MNERNFEWGIFWMRKIWNVENFEWEKFWMGNILNEENFEWGKFWMRIILNVEHFEWEKFGMGNILNEENFEWGKFGIGKKNLNYEIFLNYENLESRKLLPLYYSRWKDCDEVICVMIFYEHCKSYRELDQVTYTEFYT